MKEDHSYIHEKDGPACTFIKLYMVVSVQCNLKPSKEHFYIVLIYYLAHVW